jgi:hypothetical protein
MSGDRDSHVRRMTLRVVDKPGVSGLWLSLELAEGTSWLDCAAMVGFRWREGVPVVHVASPPPSGASLVESLSALELAKVILS